MPKIYQADNDNIDSVLDAIRDEGSPPLVFLRFNRPEIESGVTGSAVDRLMSLSDATRHVRALADTCVLEVGGYDDDPRELYEIPEVRAFFRALVPEWGGWLHFLEKEHSSISVLVSLLVDMEAVERRAGKVSAHMRDPAQFRTVMLSLFNAMNLLYIEHGLTDTDALAMTDKVMAVLNRELAA